METKRQQKRGRERRVHILNEALRLLEEKALEDISLADVAARTGVPLSSLYHFYPNLEMLLVELVPRFHNDWLDYFRNSRNHPRPEHWPDCLEHVIKTLAEFFRLHPGYQQLMLSGKAPEHIKRAAPILDDLYVQPIFLTMGHDGRLPEFDGRTNVFAYALRIAELAFSVSVIRSGQIGRDAVQEACRAACAYLRTYLPA